MPDLSIGVAFKPANRGRSGVVRWGGGGGHTGPGRCAVSQVKAVMGSMPVDLA